MSTTKARRPRAYQPPHGFTEVKATDEECEAYRERYRSKGWTPPAVLPHRVACACGTRIWAVGVAYGSHRRACTA